MELQLSISPSSEYSELISFKIHWFNLLAVQGTLKSLLKHHNWTFASKVVSPLFNMLSTLVIAFLHKVPE